MGDGSASIMPVAAGVLIFVVALTMILSMPDYQQTSIISPGDISEKVSCDPSKMLDGSFVTWVPGNGYKIENATNVSDSVYTWYGVKTDTYERFTDPSYDNHHVDARIIRNNTLYGASYDDEREFYTTYYDFIAFDGFIEDWGIHHHNWISQISYNAIEASHEKAAYDDKNYTVVQIPGEYNISIMIKTPSSNGSLFADYLWANNYTLYIVQQPQPNYNDFLSVLWWIISFNDSWMPDAPLFTFIISFLVDILLIMMMLFVIQGFIP